MDDQAEDVQTKTLDHFKEFHIITKLFADVIQNCQDEIKLEADIERVIVILDSYQEQPHLLDPHLEVLIGQLLGIINDKDTPNKAFHHVFKYLYLITKVRGYKFIIRFFSHNVADLEPILKLLLQQNPTDFKTWETRYVLLLWLSMVCIIPFDLSRLDGHVTDEEKKVVNRILKIAKIYLCVSDKSKDAAAYLSAKVLTRPDVVGTKLEEFIYWCISELKNSELKTIDGMNKFTGILQVLALLFKHGRRNDLLPYASRVLSCIVEDLEGDVMKSPNTLIRKCAVKLIQRVGLVFLPPRVASWRYLRGNRSLSANLKAPQKTNKNSPDNIPGEKKEPVEEDFDIPEEVESVIGFLLSGLEDFDTIVRWSSAKGVGRLTGRLPLELADEVVDSLLSCFSYSEQDGAWHGGCLALAELGRRGLLLPKHLHQVVPIVLKALLYDERRGSYSVGSHVRDAACYVCWSFARAYHPDQMKAFVQQIASQLLIVTVFDREVNCRRAASAAFQEHVGRQGMFSHGIDILTTADYFAVGNRMNCFCHLSVFIAGFTEYTHQLIDHLVYVKVSHWDCAIRELTTKALHNLTAKDPQYMRGKVLPELLKMTSSLDICAKHGSIIALAEIVHALYLNSNCVPADDSEQYLKGEDAKQSDETILIGVKQLVGRLSAGNEFKGFGGELMRKAVCTLIEKFAESQVDIEEHDVLASWLHVIETTLPHTEPLVQEYAIRSLGPFFTQYVQKSLHFQQGDILRRYLEQLKSSLKFERMGYAKAVGAFPLFIIKDQLNKIIDALMECMTVDDDNVNAGLYAEARKNSIEALANICKKITEQKDDENVSDSMMNTLHTRMNDIYSSFFTAMNDYTKDRRGDVGAWARESAMTSLVDLTCLWCSKNYPAINEQICHRVVSCLLQQGSEKIDRMRQQAGKLLLKMIHFKPEILCIPGKDEILRILPSQSTAEEDSVSVNWAAPQEAFNTINKLLTLNMYRYPILLGLVTSAGGLTESLVRHSSDCLLNFITEHQESEEDMDEIANYFIQIFENFPKDERVIIPMLKVLDTLFSSGCFDLFGDEGKNKQFPQQLLVLLKTEVKGCGDIRKLLASINVFCCLLQFQGEVRTKSLQHLMMFLCHKYPRIRKGTSEQLYTTLLTYDDILPQHCVDDVMSKLTDVSWDGPLEEVRRERNKLCEWLDVPVPKIKKKPTSGCQQKQMDDLDSYKDLVTRTGY